MKYCLTVKKLTVSLYSGHDSHGKTKQAALTRGTALDRELGHRMQRTTELINYDYEMHVLRLEQEKELHLLRKKHAEELHAVALQREQEKLKNERELHALKLRETQEKFVKEKK